MARAAGKLLQKTSLSSQVLGRKNALGNFLNPGARVADNLAHGEPITGRNLLDPAGMVLLKPPAAPPPPPVFPDVEGAALAARRNIRKRALGGGVGSTILTGGYSPTGQAVSPLGGA
jgi:hypothetical protein